MQALRKKERLAEWARTAADVELLAETRRRSAEDQHRAAASALRLELEQLAEARRQSEQIAADAEQLVETRWRLAEWARIAADAELLSETRWQGEPVAAGAE